MTLLSEEAIFKLKNLANNRKPVRFSTIYSIDGEKACRETFLLRKMDKSGYIVGHDDYLEKYSDIPDLHFKYQRHEFEKFEDAINFMIDAYGFDANGYLKLGRNWRLWNP